MSTSMAPPRPTSGAAPARRVIVRVTIGSFSLAALLGIIALLGGQRFGQTQGRVLLTTLLVGVVSVAVLCYLATAGRSAQPVGVAGGVIVVVPLVTALMMIWGDLEQGPPEWLARTFGIGAVVAASLAQASLVLTLAERGRLAVQRLLVATLALVGILALLVCILIAGYDPSGDGYARVLGVVAILDVLGTVVVAALTKFGGDPDRVRTEVRLPDDLARAVQERATATGLSRDDVVADAVRQFLEPGERG